MTPSESMVHAIDCIGSERVHNQACAANCPIDQVIEQDLVNPTLEFENQQLGREIEMTPSESMVDAIENRYRVETKK